MKKNILPLLLLLMIAMQSCMKNKYETTPAVMVDPIILVNATDTATYGYNFEINNYTTDTLFVGDTLLFTIAFDAVGNNLTKAQIGYQSEYADLKSVLSSQLDGIVTETVAEGSYTLDVVSGYRAIIIQFNYIPKKEGQGKLLFRVESDSEYSPVEVSVLTPIAQKAEEAKSDETEKKDGETSDEENHGETENKEE